VSVDPPDGAPLHVYASADPDGFDEFYSREYRPLLRLAWSLTGRRDLGEELVQETMLTVHRRWSSVGAYESPGGFARRVLLNDATSHARRRSSERRALRRIRVVDRTGPPAAPPDESLWAAVRSLPKRQAQAVALHYLEDRSIDEIAAVLDIAAGTVKVHLHRGRLALAETLHAQEMER
jgi:RNA polymerase sigma-70 factor (ECF subfamily)